MAIVSRGFAGRARATVPELPPGQYLVHDFPVLSAGPILATLGISLTKWDLLTAPKLVGLDNYIALVTDTGRFQYTNTTPKALRLAAELVDAMVRSYDEGRWVTT